MLKNFGLNDYTIPADDYCVISTQKQAELRFLQQGFTGSVFLEKVTSVGAALNADVQLESGQPLSKIKFFWVCHNSDGSFAYMPLFIEDAVLDDVYFVSSEPLTKTTLIQSNGVIFMLYVDSKKRVSARILTTYYCQGLIEALCRMQGVKFEDIYPVRMTTIPENKKVGVCWSIVFEDMDEYGEPVESVMLMPVSVYDSMTLSEIGLKKLNTAMLKENELVQVGGVYYTLQKNNIGGYFFKKNVLQMLSARKMSSAKRFEELCAKKLAQEIAKTESEVQGKVPVTIIPLFKKDGK